jgi:hypothetical protein
MGCAETPDSAGHPLTENSIPGNILTNPSKTAPIFTGFVDPTPIVGITKMKGHVIPCARSVGRWTSPIGMNIHAHKIAGNIRILDCRPRRLFEKGPFLVHHINRHSREPLAMHHSHRSASIGSTFAARRAGM